MTYPVYLRSKFVYIPLILGSLVASFYLLGILKSIIESYSSVFTILLLALIITVILKPIVDFLKKYGVNSLLAITFAFVVLFAFITITGIFLIPSLIGELNLIANKLPDITSNATIASFLSHYNLGSYSFTTSFVTKVNQVIDYLINNSFSFIQNFFTIFLNLFIAFFISFYFLSEGEKFKKWMIHLTPIRHREDMTILADAITESLHGFIKGQTLIAAIIAIATMLTMQLLGLQLVVLCGIYVFIAMFIPVVGPFLCILLPVIVAILSSYYATIILICVLFIVIQFVVNIMQPKIFSKSLGIHPVLAVLSVLIGAQSLGILGALFALPFASVIQTLVIYYTNK